MPKKRGKTANPRYRRSAFKADLIVYAATGSNTAAVVKLAVAEKHMLGVLTLLIFRQSDKTRQHIIPHGQPIALRHIKPCGWLPFGFGYDTQPAAMRKRCS